MSQVGILLEIEGIPLGFCSENRVQALAAAAWAERIEETIREPIPSSQSSTVNPFDGSFSFSGNEIRMISDSGIFAIRQEAPIAELSSDLSKTDTIISVDSTSGFPFSGRIWIGAECIDYTETTSTTFGTVGSPCARGSLNTRARPHKALLGEASQPNEVYGFNPKILKRIARIAWYDLTDGTINETIFSGVIDDFEFGSDGFTLRFLSIASLFEDSEIMIGPFVRGVFLGAFFPGQATLYQDLPKGARGTNAISIGLESPDRPFPNHEFFFKLYKIGNEVFEYIALESPAISAEAGGEIDEHPSLGLYFETDGKFEVGDFISYEAFAPTFLEPVTAKVTKVSRAPIESPKSFRVYHTGRYNVEEFGVVTTPARNLFSPMIRAILGSPEEDHKIGDDVQEIRFFRANQAVALLMLLLSEFGDFENSHYDKLPPGWGAGIPQEFVDIPSIEKLIPLCTEREYLFEGSDSLLPFIKNLARITGARIFINRAGVLTASLDRELYPDSISTVDVGIDQLQQDQIPTWHPQAANIFNSWVLRGNSASNTNYKDEVRFQDEVSIERYGRRPLAPYEDRGLKIVRDGVRLELLGISLLQRWSNSNPIIDLAVSLGVGRSVSPGNLVRLFIPHLPNLAGGSGLNGDFFEVLEVTPQEASASARIRLAQMPPQRATRLISPTAEVLSADGQELILKPSVSTRLSPSAGKNGLPSILFTRTGQEDIDYFTVGLPVRVIRRASLGLGPFEYLDTTIAGMDYPTRLIELQDPAGWTLASGDLLRLRQFSSYSPIFTEYQNVFCFFRSISPGAEPRHVWGV